jgi:hypothetical protein
VERLRNAKPVTPESAVQETEALVTAAEHETEKDVLMGLADALAGSKLDEPAMTRVVAIAKAHWSEFGGHFLWATDPMLRKQNGKSAVLASYAREVAVSPDAAKRKMVIPALAVIGAEQPSVGCPLLAKLSKDADTGVADFAKTDAATYCKKK